MPLPLGPQLIGQTEKALNAVLGEILDGRLTEPEWVTLRLAHLLEEQVHQHDDLVAAVADRARFADAARLVEGLTDAGLLHDGRPTARGRALVAELQATVTARTDWIWRDLPAEDVAATERVLAAVHERARSALA
ncbi:MarR family transcriptional regulator [Nocardioides sp.]|uniref:MarR family transcriptional regulator n=1 Tax=Nocardioides sp. TaxID=35761 RepID=UPI002ED80828